MKSLQDRNHAFVIKIWEERREVEGATPMWRGSVDDVETGIRAYFLSLAELSKYLEQRSGMPTGPRALPARLLERFRRRTGA